MLISRTVRPCRFVRTFSKNSSSEYSNWKDNILNFFPNSNSQEVLLPLWFRPMLLLLLLPLSSFCCSPPVSLLLAARHWGPGPGNQCCGSWPPACSWRRQTSPSLLSARLNSSSHQPPQKDHNVLILHFSCSLQLSAICQGGGRSPGSLLGGLREPVHLLHQGPELGLDLPRQVQHLGAVSATASVSLTWRAFFRVKKKKKLWMINWKYFFKTLCVLKYSYSLVVKS